MYIIPFLLAPLIAVGLLLYAWPRRHTHVAWPFMFIIINSAAWSLLSGLEKLTVELPLKEILSNAKFIFIALLAVAWMVFSLAYTGRQKAMSAWRVGVLMVIPGATIILAMTTPYHALMFGPSVVDVSGPIPVLMRPYHPWFWVHTVYSYGLLILGTALIGLHTVFAPVDYRRQSLLLTLGMAIPLLVNLFFLLFPASTSYIDYTPVVLTVSGVLMALGIFRFHLLELVPLARSAVVENMNDVVLVMDDRDRVIDHNPVARHILGITATEIIGAPILEVLHPLLDGVRQDGDVARAEDVAFHVNGKKRLFEANVSVVESPQGRRYGCVLVLHEVTARREAEEALRESEARYRHLVEHAHDVIYQVNTQGRFTYVNPVGLRLGGYTEEEAIGKHFTEVVREDYRTEVMAFYELQLRERIPSTYYEFPAITKNGLLWIGQNVQLFMEQDTVIGFQAIARDLTEQKRVEDQVRKLNEELEQRVLQRTAELASVNQELQAKNTELDRYTYTVSHDLKAPLITIKGFLDLLERDTESGNVEAVKGDIAFISEAADKMSHLLDELLELSRVGRLMNTPEKVGLTNLAYEAADLVGGRIAERGVDIDISPEMPVVEGDRMRLTEVLQNLIENAVKYMGDQSAPAIWVSAEEEGEEVVCAVRDNGVGIDPKYHEKVFGLFERLSTGEEGTGIGLALVKRIVEVHGGRIWVESEGIGQGSTFFFTLPMPAE